jgi:succinyl-diaminopimelate desuccinylase
MNVVDLLLKLLSYESITPDDAGSLKFIEEYLDGYEAIYVNKEGVKNLFLTKKFSEGPHLCFAGHVDVVPAGDGWETNPFVPVMRVVRLIILREDSLFYSLLMKRVMQHTEHRSCWNILKR